MLCFTSIFVDLLVAIHTYICRRHHSMFTFLCTSMAIQTVDLMKSGSQKQEVVYPVESQSALVDALFDKLNAKEGGPLDNLYKQTLLSMLAALTDIGKFKDECMLFIVDATSASGQQSIHDFVLHSREQTHLTIFTFISTDLSIQKSLNKTISVYALRKAGQVDVECS